MKNNGGYGGKGAVTNIIGTIGEPLDGALVDNLISAADALLVSVQGAAISITLTAADGELIKIGISNIPGGRGGVGYPRLVDGGGGSMGGGFLNKKTT